jgi:serine/threonine protein kinase
MELKTKNLQNCVDKEILSQSRIKRLLAEIVVALQYLHECGVLYCDLKPANVLLENDGYIKLANFGLSRLNGFKSGSEFVGTPE